MGMRGRMAEVDPAELASMEEWGEDEMLTLLDDESAVDLDKSWDLVFQLIEALATPASLMDAARPIGDELAYGPAMCVDPDHVSALAVQLARVDDAAIAAAYDTIDLTEVEPEVPDNAEARAWALDALRAAAHLFERAAVNHHAIVFAVI